MTSGRAIAASIVAAALVATLRSFASAKELPAERIVSLAPSITETLFAIGAGGEVVGVSQYCDYPDAARRLPKVGSFLTPNVEAIAALRPTLIIGVGTSSNLRELRALQSMGASIMTVQDDSLAQLREGIIAIGARAGRLDAAKRLVAQLDANIAAVRRQLRAAPLRKVLMVVGHEPMVAVGRGTFLDELIRIAHGANIADRAMQAWPQLGMEYVIAMAPEVILDGQMGSDARSPDHFWDRYPAIPAVRNHRVYGYDEDQTLRSGPRVSQSLDLIAALIHPEAAPVAGVSSR